MRFYGSASYEELGFFSMKFFFFLYICPLLKAASIPRVILSRLAVYCHIEACL